ncbi:MAG: hypothetical protein IPL61_03395 [Myxococcales bacterium]|nr:hypothetical protein [Myxococcales bacterium]
MDHPDPCARCGAADADADAWPDHTLPAPLRAALVACVRCLAHDGVTIDRAHVEAVHLAFGATAEPLEPWLAARAVAARPELAGAPLLVAPPEAILVAAAENHQRRLDRLLELAAPAVILDEARAALADAQARPERLTWELVAPWPAATFPGTTAFAEIARTLAALALPALVDEPAPLLARIDLAATALVLDAEALAARHALAAAMATAATPAQAGGLELAVRFLDELGHTDLRDNQDTLVDDCYFALRHHGRADVAARVYRTWLDDAVPRAWRAVAAAAAAR